MILNRAQNGHILLLQGIDIDKRKLFHISIPSIEWPTSNPLKTKKNVSKLKLEWPNLALKVRKGAI